MSMLLLGAGGAGVAALLLDSLTAAAAYSFRKLRTAYAGSAVRIRRSSDDAELDVGFSGNAFNAAAAATHIGAGSGFIVTWYDQSGNGHDLTQATTTKQPLYVASASNSKPAARFDGTDDNLDNATVNQAQPVTHFVMAKYTVTTTQVILDGTTTQHVIYYNETGNNVRGNAGGTLISLSAPSTGTYNTTVAIMNNASSKMYLNGGTATTGEAGGNAFNTARVGALRGAGSLFLANDVVELISVAGAASVATLNTVGSSIAAEYALTWTTAV